jgi:serine/threonine-protein kinase
MEGDRWRQTSHLYHAALLMAVPDRAAFVREACAGDEALQHEVESLLALDDSAQRFLATPAAAAVTFMPYLQDVSLIGRQLGSYRVDSLLGAGGMGEVYRAHDAKLGRDVAIKVLPRVFNSDPGRLARFEREARLLATLNHPHIGAIYGLEDSTSLRALVLELVEGPTLADVLSAGPLAVHAAVTIARQIAEALEAAHEKGIIHRDLKPANIKVTSDGIVKVLDFGLAKAVGGDRAAHDLSVTVEGTRDGVILGTAGYMSPEQARGQTVDKRTDIWSFGCVLFEMLTGRVTFPGNTVSDTISAILEREPDWSALPAEVSPALRALLRRCLEKDRRERIADISTALFVLKEQASLGAPVATASVATLQRRPLWWRGAVFAGLMLVAAVTGAAVWFATRPVLPSVVRTMITTSGSTALTLSGLDRDVAITPDGSRVIYRGDNQLLVRALNQLEPTALSGLGAPQGVFTSPDGQWVGFFDNVLLLKKVAITGGSPVTVCAIEGTPRGATWGEDATIIFATNAPDTGLQRVSAAGGQPTVLTTPNRERGEGDHLWPEFLPGGQAVLFTITPANGSIENAQVAVLDLLTGTSKVLIRGGSHAHYVPTGHLVYGVAGTLRAVAFDLGRLEVAGTPIPVLDGVATIQQSGYDMAAAANGSLVYLPSVAGDGRTIVAVDRQGQAAPLPGLPPDSYRDVRVSPDGARLALSTQDDVWTYSFMRATLSRLTTDAASDHSAFWTPNGQRIIFTSRRAGYPELFSRPADGTGNDERLLARAKDLLDLQVNGWSADGRQLLFAEVPPNHQCAIGQIATDGRSDANMLVKNGSCNWYATVSPNGGWMAYESGLSGRAEIYVERYPDLGNRQQISTGGGSLPLWSRDGRELFFSSVDGRQMLAVPVQSGPTLVIGRPHVLFEFAMDASLSGRPYDISPDGRFLIIRRSQPLNLIVVQNWQEELKRLVPTR